MTKAPMIQGNSRVVRSRKVAQISPFLERANDRWCLLLEQGEFGTGALHGARRESLEPDLQVNTQ